MRVTVLIGKVGLDGHDRGARVLTEALRREGFDARFSGVRRTPKQIAAQAVALQADCVGLSSHVNTHLAWFPKVSAELRKAGWNGSLIGGGIIPEEDVPALLNAGFDTVFPQSASAVEIASAIRRFVAEKHAFVRYEEGVSSPSPSSIEPSERGIIHAATNASAASTIP